MMLLYTLLLLMSYFNLSVMQTVDVDLRVSGLNRLFEHSTLNLRCRLQQFDVNRDATPKNITLSFIKDDRMLTNDKRFIDEVFGIRDHGNSTPFLSMNDRFNAQLRFQVTRDDGGYYECCAYDGDDRRLACDGKSIEVKYAPVPHCSPSGGARVHLGDKFTLSCVTEGGNLPVALKWTYEKSVDSTSVRRNEVITRKNAYNVASDITLRTSLMDINDVYTCEAMYGGKYSQIGLSYDYDTEGFGDSENSGEGSGNSHLNQHLTRRCTISVHTIWPALSVHPTEVVAELNDDVTFKCHLAHLANVMRDNYTANLEWNSKPPINQSRIFTSVNEFGVNNIAMTDNGTIISCFVLFETRWLKASAMLYVRTHEKHFRGVTAEDGWKSAFIVVFIAMIAATVVIAFLYLKRCKSSNDAPMVTNVITDVNEGPTADLAEESYMDLQKPTTKENVSGIEMSIEMSSMDTAIKNDYVYENHGLGNVGESQQLKEDEAIYECPDTEQ